MQTSKCLLIATASFAAICITSSAWAADPDTDVQAKAREALRLKMQTEAQSQGGPAGSFAEVPAAPAADAAALAKARESIRKKMLQMEKDPSQAASTEAEARALRNAKRNATMAFPPIERPASPLSDEKQNQLAELLKRYQADELTPEEYHRERVKIIGNR